MKPTIGRIVHYRLAAWDNVHERAVGEVCAAIVVAVWGPSCVNLQVFLDGHNHGQEILARPHDLNASDVIPAATRWVTSRTYSETGEPGTWCWPPRAEDHPGEPIANVDEDTLLQKLRTQLPQHRRNLGTAPDASSAAPPEAAIQEEVNVKTDDADEQGSAQV